MFLNKFKTSKKVSYEVSDNLGLTDSEKQGIEANKAFDDFVVTIESINQLLLRDEREAAFNVLKKNEKQTLYGITLELPMPISTDFYAVLDKFNSNKPRAVDIRPFEVENPHKEVEKVADPVEKNIQDETHKALINDSQYKPSLSPENIIAAKDAEIERLRKQINQSVEEVNKGEDEYEEFTKSTVKSSSSKKVAEEEHINIFNESSEKTKSDEGKCSQCGSKNIEGSRFCSSCGNNLSEVEVADTQEILSPPLEELDEKVLEELPMEFSKLFSLKEGWNIRPKIEHEVALEFEMKKEGVLKKVQENVEIQKKEAIETERKKFEEKESEITSEYAEKLTLEKNNALSKMEQDKKDEIEKRLDLRRQYLKQWYYNGLAQLDGKQPIQDPLQVEG